MCLSFRRFCPHRTLMLCDALIEVYNSTFNEYQWRCPHDCICDCCVEYMPLSNFHHANANYSCYYEVLYLYRATYTSIILWPFMCVICSCLCKWLDAFSLVCFWWYITLQLTVSLMMVKVVYYASVHVNNSLNHNPDQSITTKQQN